MENIVRSEQELVRIEKLDKIREYCNPYPDKYDRTHTLKEARLLPDGTSDVRIAGRIVFMRKMGKMSFLTIRDIEGKIQLSINNISDKTECELDSSIHPYILERAVALALASRSIGNQK